MGPKRATCSGIWNWWARANSPANDERANNTNKGEELMGFKAIALDYMMDNGMADASPKTALAWFSPEEAKKTR